MSYTKIPTKLLVAAANFLPQLGYRFERADYSGDVEFKLTSDEMFRLLPLIKWLDYIETTWDVAARDVCQCSEC